MIDAESVNEEYKEYISYDIIRAIKQARKGKMELSIEDLAMIIKESLGDDEVVELKEKL